MNSYRNFIKEDFNKEIGLSNYFSKDKFGGKLVEIGVKSLPGRNKIYAAYDKEILSFMAYGIGVDYMLEFMIKIDTAFISVKREDLYNHVRSCGIYFSQKDNGYDEVHQIIGDFQKYVETFIDDNINKKVEYKTIINYHIEKLLECCNNSSINKEIALDYNKLNSLKADYLQNIQQAALQGDIATINIYTEKINDLDQTIKQLDDPDTAALINLMKYVLPSLQQYKSIINK